MRSAASRRNSWRRTAALLAGPLRRRSVALRKLRAPCEEAFCVSWLGPERSAAGCCIWRPPWEQEARVAAALILSRPRRWRHVLRLGRLAGPERLAAGCCIWRRGWDQRARVAAGLILSRPRRWRHVPRLGRLARLECSPRRERARECSQIGLRRRVPKLGQRVPELAPREQAAARIPRPPVEREQEQEQERCSRALQVRLA